MLRSSRICASRCAGVPPSPNSRSNTTRGFDFHRQRRGRRPPGDRVPVDAAVAVVAVADEVVLLERHLERQQRRVLADRLRRDLVDGDARLRTSAPSVRFGMDAAQPDRLAARMLAVAVAERLGLRWLRPVGTTT